MTDVFNAPVAAVEPTPVETLVGEGKKFKTTEELARGKIEADAFIEKLKQELAEVREDLTNRESAETQLNSLKDEIARLKQEALKTPQPKDNTSPSLTELDVKTLVEKTMTQVEASKTVQQNINNANARMIEHFGSLEEATKALEAKAVELGLSKEFLRDVAGRSPTAFFNAVVGDAIAPKKSPSPSVTVGTVSTEALIRSPNGAGPKPGTHEYFTKLRKENPKMYHTPAIQQQIFKAVKEGTYVLPA